MALLPAEATIALQDGTEVKAHVGFLVGGVVRRNDEAMALQLLLIGRWLGDFFFSLFYEKVEGGLILLLHSMVN